MRLSTGKKSKNVASYESGKNPRTIIILYNWLIFNTMCWNMNFDLNYSVPAR